MKRRTLYDCANARVNGDRVRCRNGHELSAETEGGTVALALVARGDELALGICQRCSDFNRMGPPLSPNDRGWLGKEKAK